MVRRGVDRLLRSIRMTGRSHKRERVRVKGRGRERGRKERRKVKNDKEVLLKKEKEFTVTTIDYSVFVAI